MDKLIQRKIACPSEDCSSSDAFHVYQAQENGTHYGHCFVCGFHPWDLNEDFSETKAKAREVSHQLSTRQRLKSVMQLEDILALPIRDLSSRGLSQNTCEAYGVRVALSERDGITPTSHFYPIYKHNKLSGFKQRIIKDKRFFTHGDCESPQMFGQQNCTGSTKTLYITEGECDCLALYQTLKRKSTFGTWTPSVVSLARGSAAAKSDIASNWEFIDQYDKIILVFDQDDAGQAAQEECCKLLAGKVYTVKLAFKDPNEMIMQGKETDLYWSVMNARKYQPDGIVNGADTFERFRHSSNQICYPWPKEWEDMNEKTYGVAPGSLIVVTSGTGSGKTTMMSELKYHYFNTTDFKIADISLEEDIGDTVGNMMSIHLNKRILLPDVETTEEELQKAHDHLYSSRRWELYDHFGGMDDDNLFGKLRYFAASGCKFIFLDHLSIVVSEFADQGDERKRIDVIMTKLEKFAKQFGVVLFVVVHLKSAPPGQSFENGYKPTMDDLRGSRSIKHCATDILSLSRNQQDPDKITANTSLITVLKCRRTGRIGDSNYLLYDHGTGRMKKCPTPQTTENVIKNSSKLRILT